MSKNLPIKSSSCIGKTKHESAAKAWQEKKRTNAGGKIDVYKCPFCSFYHIGHSNQGIKPGRVK